MHHDDEDYRRFRFIAAGASRLYGPHEPYASPGRYDYHASAATGLPGRSLRRYGADAFIFDTDGSNLLFHFAASASKNISFLLDVFTV